jgi:putative tryptophan/tyrosine transport system substrate-binding protein
MREATQTVPVVFALVGDPVGNGFVANPARPGGNATGFQNFEPAVAEKWLTLLQEIAPGFCVTSIAGPNGVAQLYER